MKMVKRLTFAVLVLLVSVSMACAATTATPAPQIKFTATDSNGNPYVGGMLYTYKTGTTTAKASWVDSTKATPNTNPIILDSRGQADVWIDSSDGAYRFKLADSDGVTIWTKDNIKEWNSCLVSGDGYGVLTLPTKADSIIIHDDSDSEVKKLAILNLLGNVYYPDYNEADQGVVGDGSSVKNFVDTIGSNSATMVLRHNSGAATTTYTFSTDETIPANVNLVVEKGAIISVASLKTLTLENQIDIASYQIFSGVGSITFASGTKVKSTWFADLATAVATIGTAEATLVIDKETIIADDVTVTIPSTLSLMIIKGGLIDGVAGGGTETLTINGTFDAGLYQVFGGDLTVSFGGRAVKEVYPEWWGENTTPGTTDMTDFVNAAINSVYPNGGVVSLQPYQVYYIAGGSNAVYSAAGDSINDGIRIRSNVILNGNNALLESDKGGETATQTDQFRIVTNYCADATSENFVIRDLRLKHTGTAGYYTNGIWINGGATTKAEHWVNNILIENIHLEDVRVGIVIRDNMPKESPVSTNDVRQTYNIKIKNITSIDCTSAVISPDGDDIIINNVWHDASGAASSYDTIGMHRGHNITIDNVHSYGLINGYGVMIRNSIGSNTQNVNISNVLIDGGKGIKIGTETTGTPTTEVVENIKLSNINLKSGTFGIDKSLEDITVRNIDCNNIFVDIGSDLVSDIGMRVYGTTSFATGVENVNINNLTIKNTGGVAFWVQNSQNIRVSNFYMTRADKTASLIKVTGNATELSMNHGVLDTGDVGIDIFGTSATIKAHFNDIIVSGTNAAIDWDASGSAHEIVATKIKTTDVITFPDRATSIHELYPGIGATLTISVDEIAITNQVHTITAESGTADNLDTITNANGSDGQVVILFAKVGDTITVKHAGGNIRTKTAADVTVTSILPIMLIYNGIQWSEI